MKKKTAVEWLVEAIQKQIDSGYGFDPRFDEKIINQSKEMEKQQIRSAMIEGHNFCGISEDDIKSYISETYGSKGSDETKTDKI